MDWLVGIVSEAEISEWEAVIGDWFFVLAFGFLAVELVRYAVLKRLDWTLIGDTITNYITLILFLGINYAVLGAAYLALYFGAAQYAVFEIPVSWASVLICIVLADLVYYWEHRFMHRVNIAWATHTVHHSSPNFNISVAYRFGPMDGFWPIFFHLPLVLLGFNPVVVFFSEMIVQLYQTALHTEMFRKLPRPVEAVLNTPSHHRVHHGSNQQYLDANYGGIFIIWDRMFGTFVEEDEPVVYGLVEPIRSVNPLVAFFHGFWRLARNVTTSRGVGEAWMHLFGPPEWKPGPAGEPAKHPGSPAASPGRSPLSMS
ncbi:sterol desaturase family protein [Pyruvatibacter mobilis]|uniref:sterol desaturase family protein n=1 Tax=Pyruvatibacter mobilis TaxID=1712261 RepID=UPI003BB0E1DA